MRPPLQTTLFIDTLRDGAALRGRAICPLRAPSVNGVWPKHLCYYRWSPWTHCPQTSNVPPKGAAVTSLFHCIFSPGVGTACLKRHPWCQHPLLQNRHLLPGIVLPTTFPRICFIMSPRPSHSAWFLWSWCFLGRRAERKKGVYKNNEIELCLKMFQITHL